MYFVGMKALSFHSFQVDAYVSDESKPNITVTQGDIGNVVAIDNGNDIIYVRDADKQMPIMLKVADEDDADVSMILSSMI